MNELKTLKNINFNYEDIWDMKLGSPEDILKQEAIKWIRELKASDNEGESYCLTCRKKEVYCYCKACCNGNSCGKGCEKHGHKILTISDPYEPHGPEEVIIFLKYFFNITEEELK